MSDPWAYSMGQICNVKNVLQDPLRSRTARNGHTINKKTTVVLQKPWKKLQNHRPELPLLCSGQLYSSNADLIWLWKSNQRVHRFCESAPELLYRELYIFCFLWVYACTFPYHIRLLSEVTQLLLFPLQITVWRLVASSSNNAKLTFESCMGQSATAFYHSCPDTYQSHGSEQSPLSSGIISATWPLLEKFSEKLLLVNHKSKTSAGFKRKDCYYISYILSSVQQLCAWHLLRMFARTFTGEIKNLWIISWPGELKSAGRP